ncbi:hypothetical protein AVM71_07375 [Piscirickettsia salmonis]|nr:hypothetical protein AVM71_07375 [Piscirickettsia salmonis]
MLGDFASLDVQNTYRGSDAYDRVFKGLAKKSKSTMGWYYGFKLHIIVNDMGELMAFKMSKATTDDRVVLPKMAENLTGKIIGDKGYISQKLFDQLYEKGLQLITKNS